MLIIFLVVLCILGLSMIRPSYACANHPSATMRDVLPSFSGNAAGSAYVTSVSGWWGTASGPFSDGAYLVPVGDGYNVAWSANADVSGNQLQTGSAYFADTSNYGANVEYPVISVSYTMQVTLT